MTARSATPRTLPRAGRPSKGDRHSFLTRVPLALAEAIKEKAEEDGMTYSDWIAEAVAEKAGVALPTGFVRRAVGDNTVQEEIPMKIVS